MLIAVFGIDTAVELPGFVELNIVKSNAPSAFVAFFVILIVGRSRIFVFSKIHSIEIRIVTVYINILKKEIRQSQS